MRDCLWGMGGREAGQGWDRDYTQDTKILVTKDHPLLQPVLTWQADLLDAGKGRALGVFEPSCSYMHAPETFQAGSNSGQVLDQQMH